MDDGWILLFWWKAYKTHTIIKIIRESVIARIMFHGKFSLGVVVGSFSVVPSSSDVGNDVDCVCLLIWCRVWDGDALGFKEVATQHPKCHCFRQEQLNTGLKASSNTARVAYSNDDMIGGMLSINVWVMSISFSDAVSSWG